MTQSRGDTPTDTRALLGLLVNFSSLSAAAARELAETQPALLSDEADGMSRSAIFALLREGNSDSALQLEQHRLLLLRCRRLGVRQAFDQLPEMTQPKSDVLIREMQCAYAAMERSPTAGNLDDYIAALLDLALLAPPDHPARYVALHNLGGAFLDRHGLTGDPSDVLAAVVVRQDVVAKTPLADPLRPNRLSGLGKSLVAWLNETGDQNAGVAALAVYEEALELTGPNDPIRSAALAAVGGMLLETHPPEGGIPTLTRAIKLFEEAIELPFVHHTDRLLCHQQLARAFLLQFAQGRDPADRDKALEVFDTVFTTLDANSAQRRFHSGYFGHELLAVYLRTSELLLLERAIELLAVAVDQAGLGTGDIGSLHDLGVALLSRYNRMGADSDLRRGVDTLRRVIRVLPPDTPRPSVSHMALADALMTSYQANGSPEHLDEAVALLELPTPDVSPGLVDEPYRLAALGRLLTARYRHRRVAADLDNAIECLEVAVEDTPPNLSTRPRRLQALGRALQLRFQRSGDESDIRRAVTVLEECVAKGHSDPLILPSALSMLGLALHKLHAGDGDHAELARSVELTRQGAEQTPVGSPDLAAHLGNYLLVSRGSVAADGSVQPSFAAVHQELLERCRELQDVRTAISELDTGRGQGDRTSADPRPGTDAARLLPPFSVSPVHRAMAAWIQFRETGADDSLAASVDAWRSVVTQGSLDQVPALTRSAVLAVAAQAFAAQFERTGNLSDANAAIGAYERVAANLSDDGEELRRALVSVATCLLGRHEISKDTADVNQALDRLAAAARRPPPGDDLWTDAVHRFIGAMSSHAEDLGRTMTFERWLEVADELLALAPGELTAPGWYDRLLLLAVLNAVAGQNRWAAAQRWADAACVCATAAGDGTAADRAGEISEKMRQRLAEAAGTAQEIFVDLNDLIDSAEHHAGPAAARERLSILRAASRQISPAGNIDQFGLVTAALMKELVMGPTGDPDANIEEALDLGQDLLTTLRDALADPSLIAAVCGDLANLYRRRAHGARSGNVERAIELATERVALLEPGTTEWAHAQAQLGFALTERTGREEAAAAVQAVACCEAALKVLDPDDDPAEWAYARNALGCAYQMRSAGSRSGNVERARQILEETLQVLGDTPPGEADARRLWANVHYNLGTAYQARLLGGNDDNMHRAIHHFERELSVSSRDRDPTGWATTQLTLAHAYGGLRGDDPAETQRRAVAALKTALSIFSRDRTPELWAKAQDALGLVLCDADQVGNRLLDLDAAADCFNAALEVYGRESHPYEWAGVQMNRTMVDRLRAKRSAAGSPARRTHLAEAVAHCRQALEVYAPDTLPLHFADAQASLGDALAELAQEEDELQDAVRALEAALEIYQVNGMSGSIRMLCPVLAEIYGRLAARAPGETQDQGLSWWRRAALVCEAGIAAGNALYESSLLRGSKNTELRLARGLVSTGAAALVRLGRPEDALILLERGRALWLNEALARDQADLHQLGPRHQDLIDEYRDAALQIEAVERLERQGNRTARLALGDTHPADSGDELLQQAAHAQERMRQAIGRIRLIPGYSQFLQLPGMDDIARVVTRQEAVAALVPSIDGCLILIAHRDQTGEVTVDADRVPDLTQRALDLLLLGADAAARPATAPLGRRERRSGTVPGPRAAARAAGRASLDDPGAVAVLLQELKLGEAGARDAVTCLLARDPAGQASLDDPGAVARLLRELRAAGAGDGVTALAARAAGRASLDDPGAVAVLLQELKLGEAGARDAVTCLLARDPAGQASLDDPGAVARLLRELRAAGAGDAVTALAARAANAGMFGLFLEVRPDEASSYPFGREPDGAPSQTWRWQESASQPR